ncbi:hypothetical protein N7G274_002586 [Stereocaulon virgatum]|uniref:Uncharacterized protein n=1 Tax=Stereocaulon virgatum TaxID=373712 RepID=A0ABR4AIX8_9LECA
MQNENQPAVPCTIALTAYIYVPTTSPHRLSQHANLLLQHRKNESRRPSPPPTSYLSLSTFKNSLPPLLSLLTLATPTTSRPPTATSHACPRRTRHNDSAPLSSSASVVA